jgi:hypothetical protein
MSDFYGKFPIDTVSQVIHKGPRKHTFTIMPLFYGNYPSLAQRCLNSLLQLKDFQRWELRIGANEIGDVTRAYLYATTEQLSTSGLTISQYDTSTNRGKYPMMRRMLYDPGNPITSEYVVWFDDDSYVSEPDNWLDKLEEAMQTCDMCGQQMSAVLTGGQPYWITTQPWYTGKPVVYGSWRGKPDTPQVPAFAVGGWWCASMSMLRDLDWPPPNIIHRGGDYMLGEAMRQNYYRLRNWRKGVVINAAMDSTTDASSPRRGWDPVPVGVDYVPSTTMLLHEATKRIPLALLDTTNI